ncbi:MAG: SDR family NAD(P)-dependent oxidoreductase [Ignavibacteria bacterium]|nr:SDR family NAD(P)-dependent oxidoreductase [Ignavibacteria bacterium]
MSPDENGAPTLAGKTAVVTGAGRGIGRAIAHTVARSSMNVVLASRSAGELKTVAGECRAIGAEAVAVTCDLTRPEDINRLITTGSTTFGGIDLLVNNAGIGYFAPVEVMSLEQFDAMWSVNLRAVFLLCKGVIPLMERRKGGTIVNIGSLAGKNSLKGGAGYAATKWALRGFSASLMLEVRDRNIRVVTIFPGSVDTSFSIRNKRGSRITQPEDVAEAVLFAASMHGRAMTSEIDIRPTRP